MHEKILVCISGPSAVGKTTLIEHAEKTLQAKGIRVAATLSSTNRPPRKKPDHTFEQDGIDYRFYTPQEFRELKEDGAFFVTSKVHGHEYGTLRKDIVNNPADIYLINIDFSGALELRERYPDNTVLVFIAADITTLQKRLEARESVTADDTARRKSDMHQQLMAAPTYDFVIYNNGDLTHAVEEFCAIIRAQQHRCSLPNNKERLNAITTGLAALGTHTA